MASSTSTCWTIVHQDDASDQASDVQSLRNALEKGNEDVKLQTMQKILIIMLNGNPLPGLLMHVIRFVMPSKSKPLKKLLQFYWEVCPKTNPDGKLKQEMILVCNAIRNDLQHPNEYVCGMTLRILCKLHEPELLEPLLPPCRSCLEHRHSYVRKNAVFAIYSIYRHSEHLIPDAPDLILIFLQAEGDQTCKRNAFLVLCNISHQKAVEYLMQHIEEINSMDFMMQSAVIELIRKDTSLNPANKPKYLRVIFDLLDSTSNTVVYEAAISLASLTSNPAAIKAAAVKLIDLAIKESDNNVKLIVLNKVSDLHQEHEGVLEEQVMELLRVLSSPDIDVRTKVLKIALTMITSKNVEHFIGVLEKELKNTVEQDYEKNTEYRQLLIHSIHTCAVQYSEVAASGIHLLMEFISEFSNTSAVDVMNFIKEVVEKFPNLRDEILARLLSTLSDIKAKKVFRGALWILGEYCINEKDIMNALRGIRNSVGELPILDAEQRSLEKHDVDNMDGENETTAHVSKGARRVLADGTYATESAFTESKDAAKTKAVNGVLKTPLRSLILNGDYYLATILASTLAKLVIRFTETVNNDLSNSFRAEAMLTMSSIIRVGNSRFVKVRIDEDSVDRIMTCFRAVAEFADIKDVEDVFLKETKSAYTTMLGAEHTARKAKAQEERNKSAIQVDDVIAIRQLVKKGTDKYTEESSMDLSAAVSSDITEADNVSSKLSRIVQLTGFSDPVYAEAFVKINRFDIILDVLLVNQTSETLQDLTLEFATLGDLKLVDRPTVQNVAAHSFLSVQATVKVSSADTGVIFGFIVYDRPGSSEQQIVILNDVHVDVMDYIQPAMCSENQFRSMWTEFEWENKVNINSKGQDGDLTLQEYFQKLLNRTNMACLTPEASLKGDCGFLSANLYAKSVFGEDALANLSVEKSDDGKITGHVRIRSKGQGMALSLGQVVVR